MMYDPLDFKKRPLVSRLSHMRTASALILFFENCGASLWRIFSWVAAFVGLWLLQIPSVFGDIGSSVTLAVFLAGLIVLVYNDRKKLAWPSKRAIDRRIEIASGLEHRPLHAVEDELVNADKAETRTLWHSNREKAFEAFKSLRLPKPAPLLAGRDPYAFRFLACLLLVAGFVAAGPEWPQHIRYGLYPFKSQSEESHISPVTLWITPPEYTGLTQVIMEGSGKKEEITKIPEGSIIKIRVSGNFIPPVLMIDDAETELEKIGEQSWGLETEITPGSILKIKQWVVTRAEIPYEYLEDTAPEIKITGDTEVLSKGELKLPLSVIDDYGVSDLKITMDLDPMIEDKPLGAEYTETRAVMSPPAEETELSPLYDLSWHPWAGLPVTITLDVTDHKGQQNIEPAIIKTTLPERSFKHPVAKEIVEMRKRLIWTPIESAGNVSDELQSLLIEPERFQYDPIAFLALRSASSRLYYDRDNVEAIARVVELLWDTALHIEEGDLPMAARNLRDAQRNLEQVLNDPDASDEQVAKALEEFRQAMAEYFQELYKELQKQMAENGGKMPMTSEMMQSLVSPDDVASFLDQLQAEALSGDRDSARELLSQMQQFMDMLGSSREMSMPPQMEFMMEGINELQELIEKQQSLLDQTQHQLDRLSQGAKEYPEFKPFDPQMLEDWNMGELPPPPQPEKNADKPAPQVDTSDNQVEQNALRYILGQLMLEADEQLGEIPEKMGMAEQEMRSSGDNLGENDPAGSIPHQGKAIEYLQDSMKDMSQQMQQMMRQMAMMPMGFGSLDPLGRPRQDGENQGMFPGSRVKIPDEAEKKRVQEILKILRQRSGEVNRPEYELEYYRRLMKQF